MDARPRTYVQTRGRAEVRTDRPTAPDHPGVCMNISISVSVLISIISSIIIMNVLVLSLLLVAVVISIFTKRREDGRRCHGHASAVGAHKHSSPVRRYRNTGATNHGSA